MCRIAGLVTNRLRGDELKRLVNVMCHTLQHGGPDDAGLYCNADSRVAFGHRRLSIIDLSANGHQPMADAKLKAWITFNGEIYNYRELKNRAATTGCHF
jgi:asparagine synthase (glutamine-hydrolysing)